MLKFQEKVDVVFICQRMLPYHIARFQALSIAFAQQDKTCLALEVSSTDSSYGDLGSNAKVQQSDNSVQKLCLFDGEDYLKLQPSQVADAVEQALLAIKPSVVFSPAPAFSEGAGAMHYRIKHAVKWILMDDAWSVTDKRSWLTRWVKQQFYRYADGGFLPSALHGEYFATLNIPFDRQRYGVDVVADLPSAFAYDPTSSITAVPYLLFVGRLIERKGLDIVLKALAQLPDNSINLVVVGDGPEREKWESLANSLGLSGRVLWQGLLANDEVRQCMRRALALVVPSDFEQWGLVVNEAWQAGLPVLGSASVGSLQATCLPGNEWMLIETGDINGWATAIARLASLSIIERERLANEGIQMAKLHSMETHVKSALQLANLPHRRNPNCLIGLAARFWQGKVAIW